ncbi:MAG TPA: polymorphic toxin type 23 domain-containing protein [Bacteroidia bacterium]
MKKLLQLLLLIPVFSCAQTFSYNKFGASVGLLLNVGTHINGIGLSANTFYKDYCFQLNAGSTLTFHLTSYGKRKKFWENRNAIGILLLGGKKETVPDFQLNGLIHNTNYDYGLGYNFICYVDNARTSQLSGGWGIHIKNFSALFENDVFAGQARDRFRTGHLWFSYRHRNYKFNTGLYIWTGESGKSVWERFTVPRCPNGVRVLEDLPYGKTSHGILYGGLIYNLGYGQFAHIKMGMDSEQIRHGFQNRLSHDLVILPKFVPRNTPHYPRLDKNGCAVYDKSQIRKNKFYLQLGTNENWSN